MTTAGRHRRDRPKDVLVAHAFVDLVNSSAAREVGEGDGEGGVLTAGGSDWLVRPRDDGYPTDEAYFPRYIVDAVSGAVRDDPEVADRRLSQWADRRRDQIAEVELTYCAHQLDLLVQ